MSTRSLIASGQLPELSSLSTPNQPTTPEIDGEFESLGPFLTEYIQQIEFEIAHRETTCDDNEKGIAVGDELSLYGGAVENNNEELIFSQPQHTEQIDLNGASCEVVDNDDEEMVDAQPQMEEMDCGQPQLPYPSFPGNQTVPYAQFPQLSHLRYPTTAPAAAPQPRVSGQSPQHHTKCHYGGYNSYVQLQRVDDVNSPFDRMLIAEANRQPSSSKKGSEDFHTFSMRKRREEREERKRAEKKRK